MKALKILRPALCLVICIAAIVVCLGFRENLESGYAGTSRVYGKTLRAGDYSYSTTDYSYYGGDAYTGIQQASADASNNTIVLGINMTEAANMIQNAQKETGNNVAELASPLNATSASVVAIGTMLSNAIAFAFAIPGVKSLMDLIQAIVENKKETAAHMPQEEVPAESEEEKVAEETQPEEIQPEETQQ